MSGNVSSGSFGSSSNVSPQIMQSVSFSFDGKNDESAKRHFFKYSEPSSSVKFMVLFREDFSLICGMNEIIIKIHFFFYLSVLRFF